MLSVQVIEKEKKKPNEWNANEFWTELLKQPHKYKSNYCNFIEMQTK